MVGYQIIIIIRKTTSCHIGDNSRYDTRMSVRTVVL